MWCFVTCLASSLDIVKSNDEKRGSRKFLHQQIYFYCGWSRRLSKRNREPEPEVTICVSVCNGSFFFKQIHLFCCCLTQVGRVISRRTDDSDSSYALSAPAPPLPVMPPPHTGMQHTCKTAPPSDQTNTTGQNLKSPWLIRLTGDRKPTASLYKNLWTLKGTRTLICYHSHLILHQVLRLQVLWLCHTKRECKLL